MKAKEYAQKIIDSWGSDRFEYSVVDTMRGIKQEFIDICRARNLQKVDAVAAAVLDFDRKWRNVIGLVFAKNEICGKYLIGDGFIRVLKAEFIKISPIEWHSIERCINERRRSR